MKAAIVLAVLAVPAYVRAQGHTYPLPPEDLPPPLDPAEVPAWAETPAGFVPAGWGATEVDGDLDGRGEHDAALLVCPQLALDQMRFEREHASCGACVATSFRCAIVVASPSSRRWRRVALLPQIRVSAEQRVTLAIRQGRLVIEVEQSGGHSSWEATLVYRWDARRSELVLDYRGVLSSRSQPEERHHVWEDWRRRWRDERRCEIGEYAAEVCEPLRVTRLTGHRPRLRDLRLGAW